MTAALLSGGAGCTPLVTAPWRSTRGLREDLIALHSPHDVISDVRVAGSRLRKQLFVISRHNLLRSTRHDGWERLTRGLGSHKLSSLVVSPAFDRDQTLFVASFGGGVFRSVDAGRTWTAMSRGLIEQHVALLAISPDYERTHTLFALTHSGTLYRSQDAGQSWKVTCATDIPPAASCDEIMLDPLRDAGEAWARCYALEGLTCVAFAVDAVLAGTSSGQIYASYDRGASWAVLLSLVAAPRITCIEVLPGANAMDRFFIGTASHGVFRAEGGRARRLPAPRRLQRVTALGSSVDADGRQVLLACGWSSGVFASLNEGRSWRPAGRGATRHRQADEARYGAPQFSTLATDGSQLYLGGFDGLFEATSAECWEPVETLPLSIVLGLSIGADKSGRLHVAASNYGAGVQALEDGGGSWATRNDGLETLRLGPIAHAPTWAADGVLFTGAENAVLRWDPTNASWSSVPLRVADGRRTSTFARLRGLERLAARALDVASMAALRRFYHAFALRFAGRISRFVFPTAFAFSPDYADDRQMIVGTRAHGIFSSSDGGIGFAQLPDFAGRFVADLAWASGGLFAAVSDGIHRSADRGRTWARIAPFKHARLAASQDVLFAGSAEGLHRSLDGGMTWSPAHLPVAAVVDGVALSPAFASDGVIFAQVAGHGLYRSTDGGERFFSLPGSTGQDLEFGIPRCFPDAGSLLRPSPHFATDRVLFAAAFDQVWRSTDLGETWTVSPRPVRYEAIRPEIGYRGRWRRPGRDFTHISASLGAVASLHFVGSSVTWIGRRGPEQGVADVVIDGARRGTIDLRTAESQGPVRLFTQTLSPGRHVIEIVATSSRRVSLDAFEVASPL